MQPAIVHPLLLPTASLLLSQNSVVLYIKGADGAYRGLCRIKSQGIHSGHCSLRLGNDWCISFEFSSFSPLAHAFVTRGKGMRREFDDY